MVTNAHLNLESSERYRSGGIQVDPTLGPALPFGIFGKKLLLCRLHSDDCLCGICESSALYQMRREFLSYNNYPRSALSQIKVSYGAHS